MSQVIHVLKLVRTAGAVQAVQVVGVSPHWPHEELQVIHVFMVVNFIVDTHEVQNVGVL